VYRGSAVAAAVYYDEAPPEATALPNTGWRFTKNADDDANDLTKINWYAGLDPASPPMQLSEVVYFAALVTLNTEASANPFLMIHTKPKADDTNIDSCESNGTYWCNNKFVFQKPPDVVAVVGESICMVVGDTGECPDGAVIWQLINAGNGAVGIPSGSSEILYLSIHTGSTEMNVDISVQGLSWETNNTDYVSYGINKLQLVLKSAIKAASCERTDCADEVCTCDDDASVWDPDTECDGPTRNRNRRHESQDLSGSGSDGSGSELSGDDDEAIHVNRNWVKGTCGAGGCSCVPCSCSGCADNSFGPCQDHVTGVCSAYIGGRCTHLGDVGLVVADCCRVAEPRAPADCCVDPFTYTFGEWTDNCPSEDDTRAETESCTTTIIDTTTNTLCACTGSSKRALVNETRACTSTSTTITSTTITDTTTTGTWTTTVAPAPRAKDEACGGGFGSCATNLTCQCTGACWDPQYTDSQWTCCHAPICCEAMTKECLACKHKVDVALFCDRMPGKYGCPMVNRTVAHVLVRPYADFLTAIALQDSMEAWGDQMPCAVNADYRDKWDLVLYGPNIPNVYLDDIDGNWSECFVNVAIIDNTTSSTVVFDELLTTVQTGWPEAKFCVLDAHTRFMEGGWLEDLSGAMHNAGNFSVIGGSYAGPIFEGMSDASKLHLNGNACYNPGHAILSSYTELVGVPYDLNLAQQALTNYDLDAYNLPTKARVLYQQAGYKAESLFTNRGNSFMTPSSFNQGPSIVHGGEPAHDWPIECSNAPVALAGWPTRPVNMSLDLLVSSVDDKRWHDFRREFGGVDWQGCSPEHPFTNTIVIHDKADKDVSGWISHARTTSSPVWDMCSLNHTSDWVMWVSTDLELRDGPIVLPVHQGMPINSYVDVDSPDCDAGCRADVMAERAYYPTCRKHVMSENPIFQVAALTHYCDTLFNLTATPSIDGYYCYIEANGIHAATLVEAAVYQRPTQVMVPAANVTVGNRSTRCNGGVCPCTDRAFTYQGQGFASPCIKMEGMPHGICPTWINTKDEFVATASDVTAWTEDVNEVNTGDWAYCPVEVCTNALSTVGDFPPLEASITVDPAVFMGNCTSIQQLANNACEALMGTNTTNVTCVLRDDHGYRQRRAHIKPKATLVVNPVCGYGNSAVVCTTDTWENLKGKVVLAAGAELTKEGHIYTATGAVKQQRGALFFNNMAVRTDSLFQAFSPDQTTVISVNLLLPTPLSYSESIWSYVVRNRELKIGIIEGKFVISWQGPDTRLILEDLPMPTPGEWCTLVMCQSDETTYTVMVKNNLQTSSTVTRSNIISPPSADISGSAAEAGNLILGNFGASHFGADEVQIWHTDDTLDAIEDFLKTGKKYGVAIADQMTTNCQMSWLACILNAGGDCAQAMEACFKAYMASTGFRFGWGMNQGKDTQPTGLTNGGKFDAASGAFTEIKLAPFDGFLAPAFVDGSDVTCGGHNNGRGIYQRSCHCEGKPLTRAVFDVSENLKDAGYSILKQTTCVPPYEFYGWYNDQHPDAKKLSLTGNEVEQLTIVHESAFENAAGTVDMSSAKELVEVQTNAFKNVATFTMIGEFPELAIVGSGNSVPGVTCTKAQWSDPKGNYCGACKNKQCADAAPEPPAKAPSNPKSVASSGGATKKSNTPIIGGVVGGVVLVAVVVGLIVQNRRAGGSFTSEEAFALLF
jgi:hypothetical protein